jgi:hypothetical protein
MSNGSSSSYVGACRKDIPYPSVSNESVPSLIDNLVTALYGEITKTVVNRRVQWNIPCDPNNTAIVSPAFPRLAGEGLLCYIIRVFQNFISGGSEVFSPFLNWSFTGNGSTTTYSLANATALLPAAYLVYIDGVVQAPVNYTIASGNPLTIVFSTAIPNGSQVVIVCMGTASTGEVSTASVIATGSITPRTLANRFADVLNVKDFGAVGDGITDDALAFQNAANHGGDIKIPYGTYRLSTGITIPSGSFFYSDSFAAYNPALGANLVFDLSVATCVTLVGGSGSCGLSRVSILRATGTPPAGSIGVLVSKCYNPTIEYVDSVGHQICWKFYSDGTNGITCYANNLFSASAYDAHIVMDTWPELRLTNCRFGQNSTGDQNCNAYVRVQGGSASNPAGGPNSANFVNCQFNQGQNKATHLIEYVNRVAGSDTTDWNFTACHVEACVYGYYSDASWITIQRVRLVGNSFLFDNGLFALNANTTLNDWQVVGNFINGGYVLAPSNQMNFVVFGNNEIYNGNVSVTGASNSTFTSTGNTLSGNMTIAGHFGRLVCNDNVVGSFTNTTTPTAAGQIFLQGSGSYQTWTPAISFGGGSTGITYSVQSGVYQYVGSFIVCHFNIILTSKGSSTGFASISLPFAGINGASSSGGGTVHYCINMAALGGGAITMDAEVGAISANFYTTGTTGVSALTNGNFTNTSTLYGTIIYQY